MGSGKTCKYHCLILCALFIAACGITIQPYTPGRVDGVKVKVTVKNRSFEPGSTYAVKYAVEQRFIRSGAVIVESGDEYAVEITIADVVSKAVGYSHADIGTTYTLMVKGTYSVIRRQDSGDVKLLTDQFSPVYSYIIKGIVEGEINRTAALEKAADEMAKLVFDNFASVISAKP